ncbi:MAG: hypothetical protein LH480_15215 [Rubrivivax sp.]|nr:hypothetical protein [Rubrivivax sp.]
MSGSSMGLPPDASVLNYVVRMVVPMRREFGRSLDVQLFMRDAGYAQTVLDEAASSGDVRLREHAAYVRRRLGGARDADPPKAGPTAATATAVTAAAAPAPAAPAARPDASQPTADELRARMLKKYTGGLR